MKYINAIKGKAIKFIRIICRWDCGNYNEAAFCTVCNFITLCSIIFIIYVHLFVK